ncbi:MAG: hypothetical protein WKF35_10415 [Ferruginibacter sp.]
MKFILSLLLIALLSFAVCLFLPWWSIAIVAFIVNALIPLHPLRAFLAGFISIFILWVVISFILSSGNDHLLADKISLLIIKTKNPFLLIALTGFIGGLVAGFASLSGSLLRKRPVTTVRNI